MKTASQVPVLKYQARPPWLVQPFWSSNSGGVSSSRKVPSAGRIEFTHRVCSKAAG